METRYSGKLRLRVHLFILCFMLFMGGTATWAVYRTLMKHHIEEIETIGDSLSRFVVETIREPLRSRSFYALQEIAMGIRHMDNVVYFDVTDDLGRSYLPSGGNIRGQVFKGFEELRIQQGTLIMEKEITVKGYYLGSMVMAISTSEYTKRTQRVFLEIAGALGLGLVALGFIVTALIERFFLIPVEKLAMAADSIGDERFVTLDMGRRKDEIGKLARSFNSMSRTLESKVQERTEKLTEANRLLSEEIERRVILEYELHKAASVDSLTGLLNRQAFERELAYFDLNRPLSLIMLDLDHFKQINDGYGHSVGDKVMKDVAKKMSGHMTGHGGIVCRWGGEEFLIALQEGRERAIEIAEELRISIARCDDDSIPSVTASLGVAERATGETTESLFIRADNALYGAKNSGRNRVYSIP